MNRLRFGALLLSRGHRFGFYLSHRVVLTVPEPGVIRALSLAEFRPSQVFVADGVAVSFFDALTAATNCSESFSDSLAMVKRMLALPGEASLSDYFKLMDKHYGAELVEFAVPVPRKEDNQQGENAMDESDVIKDFNKKYEEACAKFGKRPNILVCGYTGSGKTSLTRAILGDLVPRDAIGDGRPTTMGYDCYENELVQIWDSKGLELGQSEEEFMEHTRDFVRQRQNDSNVDNHIHLVWYAIQGSGARVTECDLNLIRNIFNPEHVIVVITKQDITRPSQRETLVKTLVDAGVPREHIVFTSDAEGGAVGCKELMLLSYEMLPEAYKDAFMEAQRIDLEARIQAIIDKRGKAKGIIATAVAAAAAAGAIPIPLSDAAVLIPVQITMIASLAGLYGLKEEAIKQSALPFVAKLVGVFAATSLLKLIPMLGSAVNATVAGTLTTAMGVFVRNNFEETAIAKVKGLPTPQLNFDVELFKTFYDEYKKNSNND